MNKLKCKSGLQMTLDDDFNVPDSKPDICKLIKAQGEVKFDDQKIMNGKLYVNGSMHFCVLYLSDESGRPIHSMKGQIPFNEIVNLSDNCSQDNASIRWEIEDLNAGIINSRKLSVKSIVRLMVTIEDIYDEEGVTAIDDAEDVKTMSKVIDMTSVAVNKKDSYRFRDEIVLPSGKSCISEILYDEIELKNIEIRLLTDKFTVKGELGVFLLYLGDGEDNPIEYCETELPFSSTIDCNGCTEDMTPDISLIITSKNIEVKPDSDGEERIIDVESVLELNIKIYEESQLEILKDMYSPTRDITPIYKEVNYENLLMKNTNKARITDRIKVGMDSPKLLQICHGSGEVKLDEVYPVDTGLQADGTIDLSILYISTDDNAPIQSIRASIPFSQLIEIKDLKPTSIFDIKAYLEQISIMMLDTEEVEVKANIVFNVIVFDQLNESILIDYKEEELDINALQSMPGMIGYVVKPTDTLWQIAKRYHTTIETIKEINNLESDSIYPGDHLLIIKEIVPTFS